MYEVNELHWHSRRVALFRLALCMRMCECVWFAVIIERNETDACVIIKTV